MPPVPANLTLEGIVTWLIGLLLFSCALNVGFLWMHIVGNRAANREVHAEVKAGFEAMKTQLEQNRADLHSEAATLRTEQHNARVELLGLRGEVGAEHAALRGNIVDHDHRMARLEMLVNDLRAMVHDRRGGGGGG